MSLIDLCDDDGVIVNCTATSSAAKITRHHYDELCEIVCVENRGTAPARLRCGDEFVQAGDLSITIPPRTREVFRKRQGATHIAAVCDAGSTTMLVVWCMGGSL